MKLEIAPICNDGYECYQAVIVSLCHYLNREYRLIFANVWRFDYNTQLDASQIGHKVIQGESQNFLQLLECFHGIKEITQHADSMEDIIKLTKQEINAGMPVACHTDSYWLYWAPNYKKVHHTHVILIVSVDDEKREFTCIDPYFSDKEEILPFDDIDGHANKWDSFQVNEEPENHLIWQGIIDSAISALLIRDKETAFERIRMFGRDIINEFTLENNPDELIVLLNELKTIRGNRISFAETLHYIARKEQIPTLEDCAIRLEKVAALWKRLNKFFLKMKIKGESDEMKHKIGEFIFQLAEEEEAIAICLGTYEMNSLY